MAGRSGFRSAKGTGGIILPYVHPKKSLQHIWAALLCIAALFCAAPFASAAADDAGPVHELDDGLLKWWLQDQGATLCIYPTDAAAGALADNNRRPVIPQMKASGRLSAAQAANVLDVEIGLGVSLGTSAFSGFGSLTTVHFRSCSPVLNGSAEIGKNAFWQCKKLKHVVFPDTEGIAPVYLLDAAFYGCESLRSVSNWPGALVIGEKAFYDCKSLVSFPVGYPEEGLGASAFYNCESLVEVGLSEAIKVIPAQAFCGCTSLRYLFSSDDGGHAQPQLENLTTIGRQAFFNCRSLNEDFSYFDTAGDKGTVNLSTIGEAAFQNCESLEAFSFPYTLSTIPNSCFDGCTRLSRVRLNYWDFASNPQTGETVVRYGVNSIGDSAFDGCESLLFELSDGSPSDVYDLPYVKTLGTYAFRKCKLLTRAVVPDGLTSLTGAFMECTALTEADLPAGVTNIMNAFNGCSALTSFQFRGSAENTIPLSVTDMEGAFEGCASLAEVQFESASDAKKLSVISAFKGCTGLREIALPARANQLTGTFQNCANLTDVTLPENLLTIGDHAFEGCGALTSLQVPKSVTGFGASAFKGCSALASLNFPAALTIIGNQAFCDCASLVLTPPELPETLTEIGDSAFENCVRITAAVLPASIRRIGEKAFYRCESLTGLRFPESLAPLEDGSVYCGIGLYAFGSTPVGDAPLPDGAVLLGSGNTLGSRAFYECKSLTSVRIPGSTKIVPAFAFFDCSALTEVTLMSGVTELETGVFSMCSSLKEFTFPETIETIRDMAVPWRSLRKVTFLGAEMPEIMGFPDAQLRSLTVVCPPGSEVETWALSRGLTVESPAVRLPRGLRRVEDGAFSDTNAEAYVLSTPVERIGSRAFAGLRVAGAVITIPMVLTQQNIAGDAFAGSTVTVRCRGSELPDGYFTDAEVSVIFTGE